MFAHLDPAIEEAVCRTLGLAPAGIHRGYLVDPSRPLSAFSLATGDAATLLPDPSLPIEPEAWGGAVHEAFAARAAATASSATSSDASRVCRTTPAGFSSRSVPGASATWMLSTSLRSASSMESSET